MMSTRLINGGASAGKLTFRTRLPEAAGQLAGTTPVSHAFLLPKRFLGTPPFVIIGVSAALFPVLCILGGFSTTTSVAVPNFPLGEPVFFVSTLLVAHAVQFSTLVRFRPNNVAFLVARFPSNVVTPTITVLVPHAMYDASFVVPALFHTTVFVEEQRLSVFSPTAGVPPCAELTTLVVRSVLALLLGFLALGLFINELFYKMHFVSTVLFLVSAE